MRKSYRTAFGAIAASLVLGTSLAAQAQVETNGQPIILPNSSSSYNQNGFNLPSMPTVNGQDIVRGSSGITCHSAVATNGPKFDLGVIGSNDIFSRQSTSVYGRISMPLGKKPKRVDCSKLYDLEIQKLKMELMLLRAGSMRNAMDPVAAQQAMTQVQTPAVRVSEIADDANAKDEPAPETTVKGLTIGPPAPKTES